MHGHDSRDGQRVCCPRRIRTRCSSEAMCLQHVCASPAAETLFNTCSFASPKTLRILAPQHGSWSAWRRHSSSSWKPIPTLASQIAAGRGACMLAHARNLSVRKKTSQIHSPARGQRMGCDPNLLSLNKQDADETCKNCIFFAA